MLERLPGLGMTILIVNVSRPSGKAELRVQTSSFSGKIFQVKCRQRVLDAKE
jgi:hypothetical protein